MKENRKQAFTLVELIVVITILAILGTIAFLSFSGYSRDSRNSVRYNDLKLIESALELYSQKSGFYPESTLPVTITYEDAEARKQGVFGDSTFATVGKLDHKPVDPLTGTEYTYSLLNTKGEYEIAAALEFGGLGSLDIGEKVHAGTLVGDSLVLGTYNGNILKVSTGGLDYVLAVPTIISGDLTLLSVNDIISNKKLAYNGTQVIPGNYAGTEFDTSKTFDYDLTISELIVFTGSVEDLKTDESKRIQLLDNLQKAIIGTPLENDVNYKQIIDANINIVIPNDNVKQLSIQILKNGLSLDITPPEVTSQYKWISYTEADGLSDKSHFSIMQDSSGDYWFGTSSWITKFDGTTWTTYDNTDGVSGTHISSIMEDSSGDLWFGTFGGVSRFDGTTWTTYDESDGLARNFVYDVMQDSFGDYWIGTFSGLNKFDGNAGWITYTTANGLASNVVSSIMEDSSGNLWFGTTAGVTKYGGGGWVTYDTGDGLVSNNVVKVFQDAGGDYWFLTTAGASRFDGVTWTTYTTTDGLAHNRLYTMIQDTLGNYRFSTYGGVSKFDGTNWVNYNYVDGVVGLASDLTRALIQDSSGNFWFGTHMGATNYYK